MFCVCVFTLEDFVYAILSAFLTFMLGGVSFSLLYLVVGLTTGIAIYKYDIMDRVYYLAL